MDLNSDDQALISAATALITQYFQLGHHRVATAVRLATGEILTALNLEGSFGCIDVCAEQNALGMALSQGKTEIVSLVTVKHPKSGDSDQEIKVVSPCGKCRELLCDYAPDALVIVRYDQAVSKIIARDLLPFRYSKT